MKNANVNYPTKVNGRKMLTFLNEKIIHPMMTTLKTGTNLLHTTSAKAIQVNCTKYANFTFNALLLCIYIFLIAGNGQNENKLNDTRKTKKHTRDSKHWVRLIALTKFAIKLVTNLATRLDNLITGFEIKSKHRRRIKGITRSIRNQNNYRYNIKYKHKFKRALMVMTATALSTHTITKPAHKCAYFDTDSTEIGIDNRCTACISNDLQDFIDAPTPSGRVIKGFGGTRHTQVMTGTLKWSWPDNQGKIHTFIIPNSFYVPNGGTKLLSPQHWAKTQRDKNRNGTGERTNAHEIELYWKGNTHQLTVPLDRHANVATFHTAPGFKRYGAFCKEAKIEPNDDEIIMASDATCMEVTPQEPTVPWIESYDDNRTWAQSESNGRPLTTKYDRRLNGPPPSVNHMGRNGRRTAPHPREEIMSEASKDLLKIHQRMGHTPFAKLQQLAKQGALPSKLATCEVPICTSCMYARMSRQPWRHKRRHDYTNKSDNLQPGDVVSVDHLMSPTHGLIAQMTGILTKKRYTCATVFVDNATRLGYVYLQQSTDIKETMKAKQAFELHARDMGISIKGYHSDNGTFRANKWMRDCITKQQAMTFAGVNAHHQNGMAERRIRELQDMARTMMTHANHRWPKCITANLWPYAIRMANDAINNSPSMQDHLRRSPLQQFSRTNVQMNIKHFQPFGCPVYVLDNRLQTQKPIPKWNDRSRVGIYLGKSPAHGRNIALVLDRSTGLVSPQFHVKFDPSFHSVTQDCLDCKWQLRTGFIDIHGNPTQKGKQPTNTSSEMQKHEGGTKTRLATNTRAKGAPCCTELGVTPGNTPTHVPKLDQTKNPTNKRKLDELQPQSSNDLSTSMRKMLKTQSTPIEQAGTGLKSHEGSDGQLAKPSGLSTPTSTSQVPTATEATNEAKQTLKVMATEIVEMTKENIEGEILCLEAIYPNAEEINGYEQNPLLAFKASTDPDTMYLHEAMREPDKEQFKEAMKKEVKDQMENGNFTIVHRNKVPKDKSILPAVWQMKRKRDIKTREVKKWKARLNIDGSRIVKGVHYDETYAPVASWRFIRLLLTLVLKHKWHSKQLDYVLAFPQAPVEKEIYMKIPRGFELKGAQNSDDFVLKLNKNVYGQKQAGRVWFQYLRGKLINELKFTQSKIDECIFYRGNTIYMLYTDDSLLAGPNKDEIEQVVKDLKKANLNVTDEGDIQDFLGINIDAKEDGTIHLTQPHLIDQILEDLNMTQDNVKTKSTPAMASKILTRDSDGATFDGSFHYRSIIGKLNYLEKGTRSDISYITHQCARFTDCPKESHAKAIRWLARYLKGTRDKGLIIKPEEGKGLELFVDADFSGNWDPKEAGSDRDTARSRHGYIVRYEGVPLIWKSQLQSEIALSSTESEYIGISYALREVIPIMEVLKEMKSLKFPIGTTTPKVKCKVFEDNSGALEMAKIHKYRPRTKHLNVKLHHFRDYVNRGEITIHKIDTKEQLADYLTKPVCEEILVKLRKIVMGW